MKVAKLSPAQRVLVPLGLGTAVSLLGDNTLYTVLPRPEIAAQAGVTLAMVGVLLGANRAVRLVFNGAAGALNDRLSRRWLLVASLFLGALSTLIVGVGRGFWPLLVGRVLWGAAWSGIWVGGNTMVLDVADETNRGRLSGQYQMWFFIGVGAAALVGAVLTDLFGFRQGLLISAGLTGLAALLWLAVLPETRPARSAAARAAAAAGRLPLPWRVALAASVPVFFTRFVFAGVMTATTILWLTDFVGDRLTVAVVVVPIASLTGIFAALRSVSSLLGAPLVGHLSDRAGRRWPVLAGVMAVGAAGTWLMGGEGLAVALFGGLVASVASSGAQTLAPALVGDGATAAQRGRILSVIYTFGDLGSAFAPPLALALVGFLPIGTLYRLCAALLAGVVVYAVWQAKRERAAVEAAGERAELGPFPEHRG